MLRQTPCGHNPSGMGQGPNSDEWEIERLDLDAYMRRVGHDGDTAPTAQTLAALHRAHLAAIPFENLDVVLGRGIAVDLDSVQAKLVERRRGGYCYEHGVLFAAALERLGFGVERMLARVGGEELERPRAPTHILLISRRHIASTSGRADSGIGSPAMIAEMAIIWSTAPSTSSSTSASQ